MSTTTHDDAAAHRAASDALCQWLGVEPKEWHLSIDGHGVGFSHERLAVAAHRLNPGSVLSTIYPDLATREGFWILRDALRAKGLHVSFLDLGDEGIEAIIWKNLNDRKAFARLQELEAALFAASVALMEREGGNG